MLMLKVRQWFASVFVHGSMTLLTFYCFSNVHVIINVSVYLIVTMFVTILTKLLEAA